MHVIKDIWHIWRRQAYDLKHTWRTPLMPLSSNHLQHLTPSFPTTCSYAACTRRNELVHSFLTDSFVPTLSQCCNFCFFFSFFPLLFLLLRNREFLLQEVKVQLHNTARTILLSPPLMLFFNHCNSL